jgi:murein DD-endopeptidase MepM/ murein hydrolase activator NlpD
MIFYWFNPILLLFNRAIRVNHEYLADNGVIQDYFDIKGYSEKLLSFIICNNIPLTSGFNHSLTKMRLMMMTKSKSSTISSNLRILVIISLMSAFFFILSCKSSKPQLVKMSFIPAGTYVGQAIGYFDSSRFVSISLEAFLMSNEITNRQFREFINWAKKNPDDSIYPVKFELGTITDNKTGKKEDTWLRKVTPICISRILNELIDQDALTKLDSKYKNYFTDKKYDDYPVVGVSKKAAEYYCIWKTDKENALRKESGLPPNHAYRLPLEQEWNYVAKQPLENINSNNKTLLQKSSEGIANSLGLTHFDDNVSEWVASSTRETNGIVRGGSWKTNNNISDRKVCDPNYKDGTVGFRIVQSYSSPMPSVLNNSIKPHTVEVIQDTTGINQSSLMSDTNSILTDQSSLNTFDTIYKKVKIEHADIITGNANSKDVTVIIGNAIVTYGNIEIKADSIVLNRRTNQLFAAGRLNKSGKIIGSPVFKEGTKEIKANEITYNFITNRGRFKGIFYKENNINNNRSYIKKDSSSIISSNEKPKLFPIKKGEYSQLPYKYQEKRINPINKKDTIIHYGIDIKANSGTVVMATAGGKVIKASWDDKGLGNLIVIDHGEGYQSWYGHLGDFSVQNGASVIKGQTIGHVGSSGVSTEPHLHFEIRLNGKNVDPMTYLK